MTPLSSNRLNIAISSSGTSIPLTKILNSQHSQGQWLHHLLDTLLSSGPNNTLRNSVYRKPTHMDQYIHWENHHNLSAKYSVFNFPTHRARVVCSNQQLFQEIYSRPASTIGTLLIRPKITSTDIGPTTIKTTTALSS